MTLNVAQAGKWRKEYFEQDSHVKEDLERGKSPEEFKQKRLVRRALRQRVVSTNARFYSFTSFPCKEEVPFPFAAINRNQSCEYLAINCHGNPKDPNIII